MVKFVIVERTICDVSSPQAGQAPFAPPRQRREAVPWGKLSEADTDRDALALTFFDGGRISNAADDKPAPQEITGP